MKSNGVCAIEQKLAYVLGIEPSCYLTDFKGQPHQLLDEHEPIRELVN